MALNFLQIFALSAIFLRVRVCRAGAAASPGSALRCRLLRLSRKSLCSSRGPFSSSQVCTSQTFTDIVGSDVENRLP